MTVTAVETLVARTLVLLADHADLLTAPAQQQAQRRQLREVAELVHDQEPIRATDVLAVFMRLTDCVARVRRASEDVPGLGGVQARLGLWLDEVTRVRDAALTRSLHRGPARRPEKPKHQGWNAPGA